MVTPNDVGEGCNEWRLPVYAFGPHENQLKHRLENNRHLRNISPTDWDIHCQTIENILRPIFDTLTNLSRKQFVGLNMRTPFVRFGSARDGLKVIDALEFDCILGFEIRGMKFSPEIVEDFYGNEKLGLVKVRVNNPSALINEMQWLNQFRIIEYSLGGDYYLNTKTLQMSVFMSLVDQTRQTLNDRLRSGGSAFTLRRSGRPPTFDIHITLDNEKGIIDLNEDFKTFVPQSVRLESKSKPSLDFDIVPALLLRNDRIPNPYTVRSYNDGSEINCPVYAVMKWAHLSKDADNVADAELLWRECTSSYEKVILDISRRNDSQKYLMTACRILKTYVQNQQGHVQLHGVAASQCLKTICFYCILFLTIPSDTNKLQGVQEALGYFLYCLKLCIENQNLPHFFFGNPYLEEMFPNSSFCRNQTRTKNLYSPFRFETFRQAKRAFDRMLDDLTGLYTGFDQIDIDRIGRFKEHLGLFHEYRKPAADTRVKWKRNTTLCCVLFLLVPVFVFFVAVVVQMYFGGLVHLF